MNKKFSDYSGSGTARLNSAWAAVKATGGKIDFDVASSLTGASTMTDSNPNLILESDGGTRITVASSGAATALNLGSIQNLVMRGLFFTGEGTEGAGAPTDAQVVVTMSNVIRGFIEKCCFVGIKGSKIFDILTGNSLVFRDCIMSGNSANVINVELAYSILIENCDFLDYAYIAGGAYSKSPDGASWIKITNPPPSVVGANNPHVRISNCRLDEASNNGIEIEDYPDVIIEQCNINIKSIGIKLTNVENVIIRQCHVGYNNVDYPMIQLINCKNVTIIGLTTDDNNLAHPYRVETDAFSATNLKLLQCSDDIVKTSGGVVLP